MKSTPFSTDGLLADHPALFPDGSLIERMVSDAGVDRVVTLDTDLRVTSWNRRSEESTGISRTEALGKKFTDIFPTVREWPAVESAMRSALAGQRTFLPAAIAVFEEGYFERHFLPLKTGDGEVVGVLIIQHDVAHRIRSENQLADLNRELQRKVRDLERAAADLADFTRVTTQDIKEPLRKSYTLVELILNEESARLSDRSRGNLRRLQSSLQRMGLLTDDLISFAEISAGLEPSEMVPLDDVLAGVLKASEKRIRDTGGSITADPLPVVYAPRRQMQVMFAQLVGNALKFVKEAARPKLHISSSLLPAERIADTLAQGQYYCICFEDHGIGIHADHHDRIFGLFERLHPAGTYGGGTGVGLALVKKIVERLGGTVSVKSQPGKGTGITCCLPKKDGDGGR